MTKIKYLIKRINHLVLCVALFSLVFVGACAHKKKLNSLETLIELNEKMIEHIETYCDDTPDYILIEARKKLENAKKEIKKRQ